MNRYERVREVLPAVDEAARKSEFEALIEEESRAADRFWRASVVGRDFEVESEGFPEAVYHKRVHTDGLSDERDIERAPGVEPQAAVSLNAEHVGRPDIPMFVDESPLRAQIEDELALAARKAQRNEQAKGELRWPDEGLKPYKVGHPEQVQRRPGLAVRLLNVLAQKCGYELRRHRAADSTSSTAVAS